MVCFVFLLLKFIWLLILSEKWYHNRSAVVVVVVLLPQRDYEYFSCKNTLLLCCVRVRCCLLSMVSVAVDAV